MKKNNLSQVESLVRQLLGLLGEDVNRDGMKDTPRRVAKMYLEMLGGYGVSDEDLLSKQFHAGNYDEMIVLKDISFHSMCEHHALPFFGTACIGYIPSDKVVGISKLARLVDMYARRFQIQERLTVNIVESIMRNLKPAGAGVVIEAVHECMRCRGVKKNATMITSALRGAFMDNDSARKEFLDFVRSVKK